VPSGIELKRFASTAEALWLAAERRSVGQPEERITMAPIRIEPVVHDCLAWIQSVRDFLHEIESAIPSARDRKLRELDEVSSRLAWDPDHIAEERAEVYGTFEFWLPQVLSHSLVAIVCSIVESQLVALAIQLASEEGEAPDPRSFHREVVKEARKVILNARSLDISVDALWPEICDLVKVRNILVHGQGRLGNGPKNRDAVARLLRTYPEEIRLSGSIDNPFSQLIVAPDYCRRCIASIEEFFIRLFEQLQLLSPTVRVQ
jgi:hypothetical protein